MIGFQHLGDKVDDDRGHSEVGASGMYRWSKCPGSVALNRPLDSSDSEYAKEGHFAHEVAASALVDGIISQRVPEDWPEQKRIEAIEAIQAYVDTINDLRDFAGEGSHEWIECRFTLDHIDERCWGTGDYALWDPVEQVLSIVDYKHGQGVGVEVFENKQLMYYCLGVLHEVNKASKYPVNPKRFDVCIVQPRYEHPEGKVRWWSFGSSRLARFREELVAALRRVDQPGAELNAGKHCQFCEAAKQNVCSKFKQQAATVFEKLSVAAESKRAPDELAYILDWIPVADMWRKNFLEETQERADEIPGYRQVPTRAQRKWVDEKVVLRALVRKGYRQDQITTTALLSPAQLQKIVSKDDFAKVCEPRITKESSGFRLVPEQTTPEERVADAKQVFSLIKKD